MNLGNLSINQIVMKNSSFDEFITFTKKLNIQNIEIRNDIKTNLVRENEPQKIKDICDNHSIRILTINALQKFNIWNEQRKNELIELCSFANKASIWAVVLVPLNDGSFPKEEDQINLLRSSLKNISVILNEFNIMGLVEPLGFTQSTLRKKSIAIKVIEEIKSTNIKLLHDTFHHKLAGENNFYFDKTGLVHISGVSDYYRKSELTDDYRTIIEKNDLIENINQIEKFLNNGYNEFFSFEPFSEKFINNVDKFNLTQKTFDFILSNLPK